MRIFIYINSITDADITTIIYAGYNVGSMMKDALRSLANGLPYSLNVDIPMTSTCHTHGKYKIPLSFCEYEQQDIAVINMLSMIRPRLKGAFCKAVFRNALLQQNLNAYLEAGCSLTALMNTSEIGRGKTVRNVTSYQAKAYKAVKAATAPKPRIQKENVTEKEEKRKLTVIESQTPQRQYAEVRSESEKAVEAVAMPASDSYESHPVSASEDDELLQMFGNL